LKSKKIGKRIDRTGERFGRLTITGFIGVGKNWVGIWECKCDCGNIVNVRYNSLYSGYTRSCGCLKLEMLVARSTKHGLSGGHGNYTRLYQTWLHMRCRCLSPKSQDYKYYGERGVKICKEWEDYKAFHDWAYKNGYNDNLTLDRVDNNGDYSPENCRWATRKEQAMNQRTNRKLSLHGETKTVSEWSDITGLSSACIRNRIYRGWTEEKTLMTPKLRGGNDK